MSWAGVVAGVAVFWLTAFNAVYAQANVQFSARAEQSGPDGHSRQARVYVGDNQVRMEHLRGELQFVEIYDMKNQRVSLLVPAQKVYMQREVKRQHSANPMLPPKDGNPCNAIPDAQCVKLGTDRIYNRPVSQWEVSVEHEGQTLKSLHWIDDERFMSLRDVWPNGAVTEQVFSGVETLDGCHTERWVKTTTTSDGKKETATLWYDPELQITIREELPGGLFRELSAIKIAPQPTTLFQVPDSFRQVENTMPPPQEQ